MARHIAADGLELFRAVVTETRTREGEEPKSYTSYYGPYNKVGTARAQITADKNGAAQRRAIYAAYAVRDRKAPTVVTVEGYVEKADVTWERVE